MNYDKEMLVKVAVRILPGLLASGHYTRTESDLSPAIRSWNAGDDWKDGHARKHPSFAVGDALDLARELLDQAALDARDDA